MSVQVRARREAASFLSSYVGAQGELLVDTTNNRVQVHDGATPGGWPAAKLADVALRTAVADAAYTILAGDRTVAYTALTAARAVTLPAASAYPTATQLLVVDESGACSAVNTLTIARAGSDTINGAASATIALPYGYVALTSDGRSRWTVVDLVTASLAQQAASNVAITGGTAALATLTLKGNTSNLAAQGTATFGALDSSTRYAAFDTYGRITWRYDDNGYVSGPILNNFALTAAGQGADALKVNLGAGGALVAAAGTIRLAATDTFATTATASAKWQLYTASAGALSLGLEVGGTGNRSFVTLLPSSDNALSLGTAAARWSTVYAGTGTINTSDAREKTTVSPLEARETAAAKALAAEIGTFRFLAAVAEKGDRARTHVGLTVQRAIEIMTAHELDPMAYAFICHDTWDAVAGIPAVAAKDAVAPVLEDVLDDDGEPTGERTEVAPGQPAEPEIPAEPGYPAGDRYGFRTDELLLFLARGFEARLAALEAK